MNRPQCQSDNDVRNPKKEPFDGAEVKIPSPSGTAQDANQPDETAEVPVLKSWRPMVPTATMILSVVSRVLAVMVIYRATPIAVRTRTLQISGGRDSSLHDFLHFAPPRSREGANKPSQTSSPKRMYVFFFVFLPKTCAGWYKVPSLSPLRAFRHIHSPPPP